MGLNTQGMLGLGDTVTRYAPHLLRAPNGAAITAVALGRYHSAFLAGGQCYVFGSNAEGQLGLGPNVTRALTPQPLTLDSGDNITAIAAGHHHTALIAEGVLYVMGSNAHGQLGLTDPSSSGPDGYVGARAMRLGHGRACCMPHAATANADEGAEEAPACCVSFAASCFISSACFDVPTTAPSTFGTSNLSVRLPPPAKSDQTCTHGPRGATLFPKLHPPAPFWGH